MSNIFFFDFKTTNNC